MLNKALSLAPNDVEVNNLGIILKNLKELARAESVFKNLKIKQ